MKELKKCKYHQTCERYNQINLTCQNNYGWEFFCEDFRHNEEEIRLQRIQQSLADKTISKWESESGLRI